METTKTATKSKADRQNEENRPPWIIDVLSAIDTELVYIDALEKTNPDAAKKRLSSLSQAYLKFLSTNTFKVDLMMGLSQFEKRAKRRATRKPLTVRKLQSLQDDLKALVEIFKIAE